MKMVVMEINSGPLRPLHHLFKMTAGRNLHQLVSGWQMTVGRSLNEVVAQSRRADMVMLAGRKVAVMSTGLLLSLEMSV